MAKTTSTNAVLGELKFEKKNKPQPRLPPNATIQRRPLNHPSVASPYAGASVQKVVYVSRSTPLMAAVKRVKKLLSHIEKRAMQGVDVTKDKDGMKNLAVASEALDKNGEDVVVRASGRAIEQALKVGEWFKSKEAELACRVEARTGSVQVVDDLVEVEGVEEDLKEQAVAGGDKSDEECANEGGAMTSEDQQEVNAKEEQPQEGISEQKATGKGKTRRKRGKRKRVVYDKEDMPEARIRWINTIEIAISLRG